MKLIRFIKEFYEKNKFNYILSGILLSFGSLFIILKQDPRNFNFLNFLLYLPLSWIALFIMSFSMGLFLFWRDFE